MCLNTEIGWQIINEKMSSRARKSSGLMITISATIIVIAALDISVIKFD